MSEYSTNVLIDFDCLFDIDFGKIRHLANIVKEDPDNILFTELNNFVLKADNYMLRYFIYTSIIRDMPYLLNIDKDAYNSIFNDRPTYRKALELSPKTTIFGLMEVYIETGGVVACTVLCKNPLEEHFIKRISPKARTIVGDCANVNINMYDVFYINNFLDIIKFLEHNKFGGKEIIIPDYWFNMDPDDHKKPNMDVSLIISATNKIKTICPYKNFELPAEEQ